MPLNEREGIKHHLMDFLETEEEYQVTSFLKDASQKVTNNKPDKMELSLNQPSLLLIDRMYK